MISVENVFSVGKGIRSDETSGVCSRPWALLSPDPDGQPPPLTEARRYRALSEGSYYGGRSGEALDQAGRALALAPYDVEILNFCAWLYSNSGRHIEAVAIYERILDQRPDWAEGYRHASGSLAAIGEWNHAIERAVDAVNLAPDCFEFALHAGSLLVRAERFEEAIDHLSRAAALDPACSTALRQLSAALWALDRRGEALGLARRAFDLAPWERANATHAAELLLRSGRLDQAVEILEDAASVHPADDVVPRLLSAAQMQRDRPIAALAAIDRAIALASQNPEYHLHRGGLLRGLGRLAAAADAFRRAAELDPADPAAGRALVSVYVEEGRLSEALAAGGALLSSHPDDEDSAAAVMHALSQRLNILDADYVVVRDRVLRPKRPPRPAPGFHDCLRAQGRVIEALIIRETRTRFGESRLGYGWALLEPILHIMMLSAVFSLLMHGRPPIGTHFFIFYFTGLIPYHVFVHSSSAMTHAITANGALLQLPLVTTFDVIIARGLLELITDVLVAAILLTVFALIGISAMPADWWTPSIALLATAGFGCGCGFINAVVNRYSRSWDKVWVQLTRILYFFSGIFYVPAMMPDRMRDILVWNPILQAID